MKGGRCDSYQTPHHPEGSNSENEGTNWSKDQAKAAPAAAVGGGGVVVSSRNSSRQSNHARGRVKRGKSKEALQREKINRGKSKEALQREKKEKREAEFRREQQKIDARSKRRHEAAAKKLESSLNVHWHLPEWGARRRSRA